MLKAPVLALLGRAGALTRAGSLSLAIALAQGGEFAFVIFGQALGVRVIDRATAEVAVVCVTLSMAATPLLFLARDAWWRRRQKAGEQRPFDESPGEGSRVILAGFGRFGQIVARVLRLKRIPFAALDVSPTHVDFVRKFGNTIYYGDASRVDLLRAAGAERAELFILAIDDPEASLRTLAVVQRHFPHLRIVARARNRPHAYALLAAGVTHVIRETFAGSLEAAQLALEDLGLPSAEARETVRVFGNYDEEMVRKTFTLRGDQKALIESSKNYTAELERLFDQDARAR
jgi:glutathione-regulated potassium-efflux system ancillary protein KefC